MQRKELILLNPVEYEHEFDRKALQTLEGTPGLEKLVREIFKVGLERYFRLLETGSYIKITPNNFPDIHAILEEACANIYLKEIPDLYMSWDYSINANTLGSEKPIITIYSGAIDLLSPEELLFVIGHECGHIKSGHMLYHTMSNILPYLGQVVGTATLGIGSLISSGINYALLYWSRMSEFTADRAGLLACQDKEVALSTMMKLGGVAREYYGKMNTNEFIKQAEEFKNFDYNTADKIFKLGIVLAQDHPMTVVRASELLEWANSGEYENIINKHTGNISSLGLRCLKCGFELTGGEVFCGHCGAKISQR
ncbi:MAG TPA: M48 family metallopeptidase [Methanobacterium sp.]|nr:M48 family metallopeptidase [Methanobacterium sp.]